MDSAADAAEQLLETNACGFDLGFSSWIEPTPPHSKENKAATPPTKRSRLCLSLRKRGREPEDHPSRSGGANSVYEKAAEGVIPANTRASTNWCVRTFQTWLEQRNSRTADSLESNIPPDILQSHDVDAVCKVMRYFVLEVRRIDGERYPRRQFDRCSVD